MKLEKLSPSKIKTGKECELKLYYNETQPKSDIKNVYLTMGSIFHGVLEENFRYKVEHKEDMSWTKLNKEFELQWDIEKEKTNFEKIEEPTAKLRCKNYIRIYHVKRCPFLIPKNMNCVEKFTKFKITKKETNQVLWISVKIDLILLDGTIVDHKTSTKQWSQEEADKEIQGQIYPIAMRKEGLDVKGFQFSVVSGAIVDVYPVVYKKEKALKILNDAFEIQKNFEEENLLPTKNKKWSCKYCEWKTKGVCREWN